jgi:cytochrome d ubiquinol oxidase subunit II
MGAASCAAFIPALRARNDALPFLCAVALFVAAFGTLAVSFYPYMIPFSVTVADAVAPEKSLNFLFWGGGLIAMPLSLIYTVVVYVVFRGKAAGDNGRY